MTLVKMAIHLEEKEPLLELLPQLKQEHGIPQVDAVKKYWNDGQDVANGGTRCLEYGPSYDPDTGEYLGDECKEEVTLRVCQTGMELIVLEHLTERALHILQIKGMHHLAKL